MKENYKIVAEFTEKGKKYYHVETPYGVCKQKAEKYKRGQKAMIMSALDKTEFFKNMCLLKFGKEGNDDLSNIVFKNGRTIIEVKCNTTGQKYKILAKNYIKGCRNTKASDIKNSLKNKDKKIEILKDLCPDLKIICTKDYKNTHSKVFVKDNYGICKISIKHLLKGVKPCITNAVDKTQYFINKAIEIHGTIYDYSLVNYKDARTKISIIYNNKVFYQTPSSHLNGCGSKEKRAEDLLNRGILGWTRRAWKKAGEESKKFNSFKVYVLEFENENERFYKVGKTFTTIAERYYGSNKSSYNYTTMYIKEFKDANLASDYEIFLKRVNKKEKYEPKIKFGGSMECFNSVNIPELNLYLN